MIKQDYKLESPFAPAGDQPEAIRELCEGIEAGRKNQVLLGVTGSGKTFTMAKIIEQSKRPALIMAPNKILAAQLYSEMKEFSRITMLNILSPITTIISQKPIFPKPTLILKKIRRKTNKLTACATRQPAVFWNTMT